MPLTDGRIARTKSIGRSQRISEHELKRIYERLRKRSYRRWLADGYTLLWQAEDHDAYIAGVRDALKEIQAR